MEKSWSRESTIGKGTDYNFALARYNGNGSLDMSFGLAGKVTTDFASGEDSLHDLANYKNGKIVVMGT